MRYISIGIIVLISLASVNSFGQKSMTRSLSQTKETKINKTKTMQGAFGEVILIEEEEEESSERHFDLAEEKQEVERHFDLAEEKQNVERHFDLAEENDASVLFSKNGVNDMMNIMVINERNPWNIAPPKSEAFLFHTAKKITNESGFYIQLLESSDILEKEHKIYQEFGNLRVEENPSDVYCYLIGNFSSKETVDKFLNDIILPRYPEAKVIELEYGKRL